jgi:hypothetical protein
MCVWYLKLAKRTNYNDDAVAVDIQEKKVLVETYEDNS